jgi:putative endonuclease
MGGMGEFLAIQHLEKKGYRLITRNYTIPGGELDLIMEENGILVFVEVKTRWQNRFGGALEALTRNKKQKMLRAIMVYIASLDKKVCWRADLIAIDFVSRNQAELHHIKNIYSD